MGAQWEKVQASCFQPFVEIEELLLGNGSTTRRRRTEIHRAHLTRGERLSMVRATRGLSDEHRCKTFHMLVWVASCLLTRPVDFCGHLTKLQRCLHRYTTVRYVIRNSSIFGNTVTASVVESGADSKTVNEGRMSEYLCRHGIAVGREFLCSALAPTRISWRRLRGTSHNPRPSVLRSAVRRGSLLIRHPSYLYHSAAGLPRTEIPTPPPVIDVPRKTELMKGEGGVERTGLSPKEYPCIVFTLRNAFRVKSIPDMILQCFALRFCKTKSKRSQIPSPIRSQDSVSVPSTLELTSVADGHAIIVYVTSHSAFFIDLRINASKPPPHRGRNELFRSVLSLVLTYCVRVWLHHLLVGSLIIDSSSARRSPGKGTPWALTLRRRALCDVESLPIGRLCARATRWERICGAGLTRTGALINAAWLIEERALPNETLGLRVGWGRHHERELWSVTARTPRAAVVVEVPQKETSTHQSAGPQHTHSTQASRVRFPVGLHVGIVPDDSAGRRVFPGISRFPCPYILAPAPYSLHFILIGSQDLSSLPLLNAITRGYRKTPVFPNTFIHLPRENVELEDANRTTAYPAEGTRSRCGVLLLASSVHR
ncbi:hypothetical protein PR048_026081 [Dryococelus australis]|uniref:Uncharacterized protein n=1 Tax=Dryococelus australis TaxID=614101 RepID=A0ABQ9GKC0_9NEOP|nr:hypothetical protein PR048_026081 [Dryococelus australis]